MISIPKVRFFSRLSDEMTKYCITSVIIPKAPLEVAEVKYPDRTVHLGHELTPTQVRCRPDIKWLCNHNSYYTLCMTDPDAPSRDRPVLGQFLHWLVTNIPGSDVKEGEVIAEYLGAAPPEGTSFHRYILLIYKQRAKQYFGEAYRKCNTTKGRPNFSVQNFVEKHSLGDPVAGNFFLAQYDSNVPNLMKQVSF